MTGPGAFERGAALDGAPFPARCRHSDSSEGSRIGGRSGVDDDCRLPPPEEARGEMAAYSARWRPYWILPDERSTLGPLISRSPGAPAGSSGCAAWRLKAHGQVRPQGSGTDFLPGAKCNLRLALEGLLTIADTWSIWSRVQPSIDG